MPGHHGGGRSLPESVFRFSLAVNLILLVIKSTAYLATGLVVALAEALHTVTDIALSLSLLLSVRYARLPRDSEHPFGHGRAEYLGAFVASMVFIAVVAIELLREGLPPLLGFAGEPRRLAGSSRDIALLLYGLSIALVPLPVLAGGLRRVRDGAGKAPALKALLLEIVNDEASLAATVTGVFLIGAGLYLADSAGTVVVALLILTNGALLMRESVSMLLGRSPPPPFYREVERRTLAVKGVLGVHDMRAEMKGAGQVHLDMHITVPPDCTVAEADAISEKVAKALRPMGVTDCTIDACVHGGRKRG